MSQPFRAPSLSATLLVAGLGLAAAAAHASLDITIPIGTCSPANASTLQTDLRLTNGAVRKPGRNPPSRYFCPLPINDFTGVPTSSHFEFQFIDNNTSGNGHLTARLMRKNLSTGGATEVARVASSPSSTLRTARVALAAPLDFGRFGYFAIVEFATPFAVVEAHTIRLTTR